MSTHEVACSGAPVPSTTNILERITILMVTPILAFIFPSWAWVIVPMGFVSIVVSFMAPGERDHSPLVGEGDAADEKVYTEFAKERRKSDPEPSSFGVESEEDFLARMRYSDFCDEHHHH